MKIGEAERWLREQLMKDYGESESSVMAAMVVEYITGLSKEERLFIKSEPLSDEQLQHLTQILQRLGNHEPVQYVLGESWFGGAKFFVDKSVLIPRPETEELVEWVVADIAAKGLPVFEKGATEADATTQLKILDVGTGSGCIALTLKKRLPVAEVWGCDVSEEALNVARRNGADLDIRVDFQGVNFLDEAQQKLLPTVDIIVSNPPYIPQQDAAQMHPNVVAHEPHLALFVPDNDALIFYRALAQFGHKRLYEDGAIYLEIHEDLGEGVMRIFKECGYGAIELRKDMHGKDRMVKAMKA
jgi:release factor glutamine methyltransferase